MFICLKKWNLQMYSIGAAVLYINKKRRKKRRKVETILADLIHCILLEQDLHTNLADDCIFCIALPFTDNVLSHRMK